MDWTEESNGAPLYGVIALVLMCRCWDNNVMRWRSVLLGWSVDAFAILTKWFPSTRLETRTKESNIYASIWVENPDA